MGNYRILAFTQPSGEVIFTVKTVQYDANEEPICFTEGEDVLVVDTNRKELCTKLKLMKKASERPILWGDEGKLFKVYKKLKKKTV
jgi:hypothetical protein